jgi:hypothetical protein
MSIAAEIHPIFVKNLKNDHYVTKAALSSAHSRLFYFL